MNSVVLIGRLTRDPEVRYTSQSQMAVCSFTIAIDRPSRQGEERKADFPRITVFGKQAENCEKFLKKGRLVGIQGRIQTGSYTNKDGAKVYTTEVVIEDQEFAESKNASSNGGNFGGNGNYGGGSNNGGGNGSYGGGNRGGSNYGGGANQAPAQNAGTSDSLDGFMNIPDGIDEELPFA